MNKFLLSFFVGLVIIDFSIAGGRELPSLFSSQNHCLSLDTIPYKNRTGSDPEKDKKNPFDLKDPKSIEKDIDYDPVTGEYTIKEKIGSDYFNNPSSLSFDEYMAYKARQQDHDYYKFKSGVTAPKSRFSSALDPLKKIDLKKNLSDRLFGGGGIQIEPHGNVDMTVGFNYNYNENPVNTFRARSLLSPVFEMKTQLEVTASIGDKLKLNVNNNSQSSFDFDNKLKLAYDSEKFTEDDIIKKIEAGNVAMPLRSTLIKGSENLFGFKTDWQFGHLKLTGLIAQQRAKSESVTTKGGGIFSEFALRPDQFDENRHFFISHFNRNNYESALSTLPEVNSQFRIKNIEVWITDDVPNSRDLNTRDIVALADLGNVDANEFDMGPINAAQFINNSPPVDCKSMIGLPTNESNLLLNKIIRDSAARLNNSVIKVLTSPNLALIQGRDFERVRARRLNSSEYTVNAELGFISLRTKPKPDQIVGIAYQFTYNGKDEDTKTKVKFKIGELSSDYASDSINSKVIFVKMLKSSNQVTTLPSYDLMMKNVYSTGGYNLNQVGFNFDLYYESQDGIQRRFIEELNGYPLLNLFT